jgi:hypothetical protein
MLNFSRIALRTEAPDLVVMKRLETIIPAIPSGFNTLPIHPSAQIELFCKTSRLSSTHDLCPNVRRIGNYEVITLGLISLEEVIVMLLPKTLVQEFQEAPQLKVYGNVSISTLQSCFGQSERFRVRLKPIYLGIQHSHLAKTVQDTHEQFPLPNGWIENAKPSIRFGVSNCVYHLLSDEVCE